MDAVFQSLTAAVQASTSALDTATDSGRTRPCQRERHEAAAQRLRACQSMSVCVGEVPVVRLEIISRIRAIHRCSEPHSKLAPSSEVMRATTMPRRNLAAAVREATAAAAGACELEDALFLCSEAGRPLLVRRMLAASASSAHPEQQQPQQQQHVGPMHCSSNAAAVTHACSITQLAGGTCCESRGSTHGDTDVAVAGARTGSSRSYSCDTSHAVPHVAVTAPTPADEDGSGRSSGGGSGHGSDSGLLDVLQAIADTEALLLQCSQLYVDEARRARTGAGAGAGGSADAQVQASVAPTPSQKR